MNLTREINLENSYFDSDPNSATCPQLDASRLLIRKGLHEQIRLDWMVSPSLGRRHRGADGLESGTRNNGSPRSSILSQRQAPPLGRPHDSLQRR